MGVCRSEWCLGNFQFFRFVFSFSGQIRSIFVVLSDDQFRKVLGTLKKPKATTSAASEATDVADSPENTENSPSTETTSEKGKSRSNKRGASSAAKGPAPKKNP